MVNDYIIFIHGVNTRQDRDQEGYSKILFDIIKKYTIKKPRAIELYWGDVNKEEENQLINMWENSKSWDGLWFQKFRKHQMLQFV